MTNLHRLLLVAAIAVMVEPCLRAQANPSAAIQFFHMADSSPPVAVGTAPPTMVAPVAAAQQDSWLGQKAPDGTAVWCFFLAGFVAGFAAPFILFILLSVLL